MIKLEWMGDTPETVMSTKAHAVLRIHVWTYNKVWGFIHFMKKMKDILSREGSKKCFLVYDPIRYEELGLYSFFFDIEPF